MARVLIASGVVLIVLALVGAGWYLLRGRERGWWEQVQEWWNKMWQRLQ